MAENKLICVIGATGNQGGSVARRFRNAGFHVRGLTRDTSSHAAQKLVTEGIEVTKTDLEDLESLKLALKNANVIFSVTNYWEPFFRPDCRQNARELGISPAHFAYDVESRQGKNIADAAAATYDSLDSNGFLVSTLSHATKSSQGKLKELYHFDSKADIFPFYVREEHPDLATKMSCIQTGYFYSSFNILPDSYFGKASQAPTVEDFGLTMVKLPDGSIEMKFPTAPDSIVPHLDPIGDMGTFTFAVYQMPPGKEYMAEGTTCSWADYIKTWSIITGVPASYRQISPGEMIEMTPDRDCGIEVAYMFSYSTDPGYDGGGALLTAADIRKVGWYRLPNDELEALGKPSRLVRRVEQG